MYRLRSLIWKQWKNPKTRVRKKCWHMSKIKGVAITMPERYFTEKGLSLPDNGSPLISRTALYAIRMQWLWEDSSVMGRPMPINGRSPPWLSPTPKAACPLPDSLHQLDGWRKEPERKSLRPDDRLRRTAPRLGHTSNTNSADRFGNQTGRRSFRPWRSPA